LGAGPFDGRVLFLGAKDDDAEPRFQISDTGRAGFIHSGRKSGLRQQWRLDK